MRVYKKNYSLTNHIFDEWRFNKNCCLQQWCWGAVVIWVVLGLVEISLYRTIIFCIRNMLTHVTLTPALWFEGMTILGMLCSSLDLSFSEYFCSTFFSNHHRRIKRKEVVSHWSHSAQTLLLPSVRWSVSSAFPTTSYHSWKSFRTATQRWSTICWFSKAWFHLTKIYKKLKRQGRIYGAQACFYGWSSLKHLWMCFAGLFHHSSQDLVPDCPPLTAEVQRSWEYSQISVLVLYEECLNTSSWMRDWRLT